MSVVIFCSGVLIGYVIGFTVQPKKYKEIEDIVMTTRPLKTISRGTQYEMDIIEEEIESDNETESYDIYNYNKY